MKHYKDHTACQQSWPYNKSALVFLLSRLFEAASRYHVEVLLNSTAFALTLANNFDFQYQKEPTLGLRAISIESLE